MAHGDIKPSNFLVEQQDGEINCRLIDFGSCVIKGQHRFPTWNPPWSPPEFGVGGVSHAVGFEQLSQADLFALSLLCVHILLPLGCLRDAGVCCLREEQSDAQWEQIISRLQALSFDANSPGSESDILGPRLVRTISQADMDKERKALLESIVRSTVCAPSRCRTIPWDDVFRFGKDQLSVKYGSFHPMLMARQRPVSEASQVCFKFLAEVNFLFCSQLQDRSVRCRRAAAACLQLRVSWPRYAYALRREDPNHCGNKAAGTRASKGLPCRSRAAF